MSLIKLVNRTPIIQVSIWFSSSNEYANRFCLCDQSWLHGSIPLPHPRASVLPQASQPPLSGGYTILPQRCCQTGVFSCKSYIFLQLKFNSKLKCTYTDGLYREVRGVTPTSTSRPPNTQQNIKWSILYRHICLCLDLAILEHLQRSTMGRNSPLVWLILEGRHLSKVSTSIINIDLTTNLMLYHCIQRPSLILAFTPMPSAWAANTLVLLACITVRLGHLLSQDVSWSLLVYTMTLRFRFYVLANSSECEDLPSWSHLVVSSSPLFLLFSFLVLTNYPLKVHNGKWNPIERNKTNDRHWC